MTFLASSVFHPSLDAPASAHGVRLGPPMSETNGRTFAIRVPFSAKPTNEY